MRNLLAFETSGRSGSVAILQAEQFSLEGLESGVVHLDQLDSRWGSAKTLAPCIERMFSKLGLSPGQLHAIAVVQGPGSFTGLRVGIATAKVMAYALNIPVIAIDTLDVIAHQVGQELQEQCFGRELVAIVDAFRGQCFWARYRLDSSGVRRVGTTTISDNVDVAQQILREEGKQGIFVAGPSMQKLKEEYDQILVKQNGGLGQDRKGIHATWLDCVPQADTVARLGFSAWVAGQATDVFELLPTYYRSSAAEEKQSVKSVNG